MISTLRHWLIMTVLSLSGGVIFFLPFLQEVYYKPLAQALSLNNTEVGKLMSAFGITAMISYFPGGWLADRLSPRKLITISLLLTGVTGLYFATFPSYRICLALHAFWGVSITLLFWAAMIRVTRGWALPKDQGKAFGILETGRGIVEAVSSLTILAIFKELGSDDYAFSRVIILFSSLNLVLGVLAWFTLEDTVERNQDSGERYKVGLPEIVAVLKMPVIWLIAIVFLTAYCAYWGTFRITPYSSDIFLLSVTVAGGISVAKMWLKPVGALSAGFFADKFGVAKSIAILFVVLIASFIVFAILPGSPALLPVMLVNVAIVSIAVFAIRGIYFALMEEGGVPLAITGTAAGIISVIGFTPDIFMPLLGGKLLDTFPGVTGYRYFFLTTAAICCVGLVASLLIYRGIAKKRSAQSP